jgi:hypothetical protein
MTKEIESHFQSVVESIFPKNAVFHTKNEGGEICIYVDWKLMDDPNRPNKHSKKIMIRITQSAVEDYVCGRDKDKANADSRLKHMVEKNLATFAPDHDSPAHIPVAVVEWSITTEMLNV